MSGSSFNLKDNLTIDNSKFLKWLESTGTSRQSILGLDSFDNLYLNSGNGDIYINYSSGNKTTFVGNDIVLESRLGVGINSTDNLYANLTLGKNSYIGTNTTHGSVDGYLGISAGFDLSNTVGSRIELYGVNETNGNAGDLLLYGGNNTASNVEIFTGDDNLRLQILWNGTTNILPDGNTVRVSITDTRSSYYNSVSIEDTTPSSNCSTGALLVAGGIGVCGNLYVGGTININDVTGNINFDSSQDSLSYTTGAIFISGGLGISTSTSATSETSGGALSVAGGVAIGKNMKIGGEIEIRSTAPSTNAQTGALVVQGGIGVNEAIWIRADANSNNQLKLAPATNGVESSIAFYSTNTFNNTATGGSSTWFVGQNVDNIGSGILGFNSIQSGTLLTLDYNGFVGISNTSPNRKLDVNGQIHGTELLVGSSIDSVTLNRAFELVDPDGVLSVWRYNSGTGFASSIELVWGTGANKGAIGNTYWDIYNDVRYGLNFRNRTQGVNLTYLNINTTTGNVGVGGGFSFITGPSHTLTVYGTTSSYGYTGGSMQLSNGITASNLNITGNAIVNGDLTVLGSLTHISTTNLVVYDNIIAINTVPDGISDTGIITSLTGGANSGTSVFYKNSTNRWTFSYTDSSGSVSNVNITDYAPIHAGSGIFETYISAGSVTLDEGLLFHHQTSRTSGILLPTGGSINESLKFVTNNAWEFVIGASTGLFINEIGHIGIKTSTPSNELDVNGSVIIRHTSNAIGVGSGGSLTILGGASIDKDLYINGTIFGTSDENLKTEIKDISEELLDKIINLRTVKYKFKETYLQSSLSREHIGFIAQDFIEDFPELVSKPENGNYALDYSKICVLLTKCIKEMSQKITKLEEFINNKFCDYSNK